jgi:adenosylcobinamide-GDP ribazoletransferase
LIGVVVLAVSLGQVARVWAIILPALASAFMAWLATRQIGGQTGDVLGAVEQTAEVIVLLVAAGFASAHA